MKYPLIDKSGESLDREEVENLAFITVLNSLSKTELVTFYVENIIDEELLEWATDEDGNFIE